jgi:hypothetical protein
MVPSTRPGGASPNGPGAGAEAAQAVREEATQVARQAREAGGEVARQARTRARDEFDRRSTMMAERASGTASDLRDVAAGLREKGNESAARIADQAAGPMDRVGDYLSRADLDTFGADVRSFAARRPAVVAVGAVAVGVVAGRLLKASAPAANGGGDQHAR